MADGSGPGATTPEGKPSAARVKVTPVGVPGNERLNAFSDGVFAIAITLLILGLKVPETLPPAGLIGVLPELLAKFAGYVLSFVVVGVYWVGQHNQLLHIHRHNRVFLWLNLGFLACVAAMPFFAGLLIDHGEDQFAIVAYCAILVVAGLFLDAIWWYASSNRRLVDDDIDPDLVAFVHRRVLAAPVLYLIAIAASFVSHALALAIVVLVPVTYIFPNPLDHYHHRQLAGAADRKEGDRGDSAKLPG